MPRLLSVRGEKLYQQRGFTSDKDPVTVYLQGHDICKFAFQANAEHLRKGL